jgi:polyisoprenoid-binding protein YceI
MLKNALIIGAVAAALAVASFPARADTTGNDSDYVRVSAKHNPERKNDPVLVSFSSFRILNAKFKPSNLAGGTAELEIDLDSLSSGSKKRDKHLKSADYLDAGQHPTAKVKVYGVKKAGTGRYRAKAKVTAHGVTQVWPIEIEVLSTDGDTVRIRASYEFKRTSFGIGKAPKDGDPVADGIVAEAELTLKK